MKKFLPVFCLAVFLICGLSSCKNGDHFITDKKVRQKAEQQFEIQKKLAKNRSSQLFGVFDKDITLAEEEALTFLYAYMPLSDLADYDGDFYLKNVRASLAARDTFSWGRTVPENLFCHFVLPIRVNNENLDSSRWVFFMELKDRIKKMPMRDAVLEVNHWCHEKVTYKGTDGRTSSPLASVKTAFGRCGEESTFTVAALRAAGIPARQCYTPRWAHGDDNHAWVEVWVDGTWHYIGACEPEPLLDMAWFTAPAKRAMLVNTNVFGDYNGPEDVLLKDPRFTRINILSNYAKTKRIFVRVTDGRNKPADSATVDFQLYNYAEFYPLHKAYTDKDGLCSFLTGYGDLVIWVSKQGLYGYQKISVGQSDTIHIQLVRKPGKEYAEIFDLVPPPEDNTAMPVADSLKNRNAERLEFENKIRGNYESTFIDSTKACRLAVTLNYNGDTLWQFLRASRGNWRGIIDFASEVPAGKKNLVFPLLEAVSEKDLRDVDPEVLKDAILFSGKFPPTGGTGEDFVKYILNPRVDNEYLKPSKNRLQSEFKTDTIEKFRKDPSGLVRWIKSNITIDLAANYGRAPLTPVGSFELRVSDPHSREILFVALCRSFGIPARLEPASRIPQFFREGCWRDVWFEKPPQAENERGKLVLNSDKGNLKRPEYYIHFTIEKFRDGFFRSLDYENDPSVNAFPVTLEIEPSYYLAVTGNRIPGGTILAQLTCFNVEKDREKQITLSLRNDQAPPAVLGVLDLKSFLGDLAQGKPVRLRSAGGYVIAWMEPDKEPTKHFVVDLRQKKASFDKWNGEIILLFKDDGEKQSFMAKNSGLPFRLQCIAANSLALKELSVALHKQTGQQFPVVIYVNAKGEIFYHSQGYRIGIGDDLLRFAR
ncbi:MAG: transglutaminase domain-containing protein [bacterium]